MENSNNSFSENKGSQISKFFVSFAINLIWMIILFCNNTSYFTTSDDSAMNEIALGYYGSENSTYLIFTNVVYANILKFLYGITHAVNFYSILEVATVFFTFVMISYVFCDKYGYKISIIVTTINIVFFSYYAYLSVQFTHQAAFCCVGGLILLYFGISGSKLRYVVTGIILALIGYMVRSEVFISVLPFFMLLLFRNMLDSCGIHIGEWLKSRKYVVPGVSILFIGFIVLHLINASAYSSDGWDKYLEYNKYRAGLLDYEVPDYAENEEFYDEIGFSENDLENLKTWTYADENKYSLENMKKIYELAVENRQLRITPKVLGQAYKNIADSTKEFNAVYLVIALSAIALIILKFRQKLYICLLWLGIYGEYWYLSCRGRLPMRSYFAIWLMALFIIIIFLLRNKAIRRIRWGNCLIASALIITIFTTTFVNSDESKIDVKEYAEIEMKYDSALKEIESDPDNLYLGDCQSFNSKRKTFRVVENKSNNFIALGGWLCPSPTYYKVLHRFDVENPIQALAEGKSNVYYVTTADTTNLVRMMSKYLAENYNRKIKYKVVKSTKYFNFYQFY